MDYREKLWHRYKKLGDRQARGQLIIRHSQLVNHVVRQMSIGLPPSLQYEDLIGYGILGLINAVDRFDLALGVRFSTYAVTRIRGQIIDSLRALDLLPRSVYRHNREIENAYAHLSQLLGRMPTDEETANYLGITKKQYYSRLKDTNLTIMSLDQNHTFENGEQSNLYSALEDTNIPTPVQHVDDLEMTAELKHAIKKLPEREQLMISLYYIDGLTMRQIGQVLNVSESRVSQIHAKAMQALRCSMISRAEPNPVRLPRQRAAAVPLATAA